MTKRKNKGVVRVYVPENITFDHFLKSLNNSGIPHESKQLKDYKFYFLLYQVYDVVRKYKQSHGYAHLHSAILQYYIDDYATYFSLLNQLGWIEVRKHRKGTITKRYKFSHYCSTEIREESITKFSLVDKIKSKSFKFNSKFGYPYIERHLKTLQVDIINALAELQSLKDKGNFTSKQYTYALIALNKINEGFSDSTVDMTGFRLHTALTGLNKRFRRFLHVNGQKLVAVDICNSQFFFSLVLLNELFYDKEIGRFNLVDIMDKGKNYNKYFNSFSIMSRLRDAFDVELFKELCAEGTIYEWFGKRLYQEGVLNKKSPIEYRECAKTRLIRILFSKNNSSNTKTKELFRTVFPSVWDVFAEIKREEHSTMAVMLQRIEAFCVLESAAKSFSYVCPDAPLFSVHDSLVTTEEYAIKLKEVMGNEIEKLMGIRPKFKIEYWY